MLVNPHSQIANPYAHRTTNLHGSMVIETLNFKNEMSSTYTFNEVYPKEIMPTNMAQAASNDYMRLTVSMEYRNYTYKTKDSEYQTPEDFAAKTGKQGEALPPISPVMGQPTNQPGRYQTPQ